QPEAPTLTYAFAPLKKGRLDYLVEKAAEMGAGRLQPILTQHGQVHRIHREKLQRNVVEACEQCGILHVPAIEEPLPLDRFLSDLGGGTLITADESLAGKEGDAVAAIQVASPPLTVLVGPEGGFSDDERRMIADRGVRVSLGPRILRADTAAVALMALVEAAHPSVA
ncbi:MAG: RsmE family RNA methyltransferase, partial [Pseudomonadota bacterium]